MSTTKKAKRLSNHPGNKYKSMWFDLKYHNLWEVKVVYKPGESDLCSTQPERVDLPQSDFENNNDEIEVRNSDPQKRLKKEREDLQERRQRKGRERTGTVLN